MNLWEAKMNTQRNSYRKIRNPIGIDQVIYNPSDRVDLRERNPSYYSSRPLMIIDSEYNNGETAQDTKGRYMFSMTKLQIVGLIMTVVAPICAGTWYLSNHISNSTNEVRKELQASMNANRQEMVSLINTIDNRNNDRFNRIDAQFDKLDTKFEKTNSRIDKVESKIDDNFKETNKNISDIKELIVKSR